MNKASTSICLFLFLIFSQGAKAQTSYVDPTETGGAYALSNNSASNPCISDAEYDYIKQQCDRNIALLGLSTSPARSTVSLAWPLREANGLQDCSYYRIAAYVDEDTTAGIKDWNCGSNTYNTHRGTDIATYPYPFFKMDNNQVEVIAAAPGTILFKSDTSFDKNCNGSTSQANFVVIQHTDGTLAYYFHMKKNSVTTKGVGQTVALGEYLGVVGSSGDATGPHLHFEVRTSTANTDFKDPWFGSCNHLNNSSWWTVQKDYTEAAIVKTQVGLTDPLFPACPITESPNEDTCIPLAASAKFNIIFRNETSGLTANMRIIKPDGSNLSAWVHNSTNSYSGSSYSYTRTMPSVAGSYVFEAVYNGDTCSKVFQVACGATTGISVSGKTSQLRVYPNPVHEQLNLFGEDIDNGSYHITVRNLLGQCLSSEDIKVDNSSMQHTLTILHLPRSIYILTIESDRSLEVIKFEKSE